MADEKKIEKKMALGVVARGHTLRAGKKSFGPGMEVSLEQDEIAHLRKRGVLVDPNAKPAALASGPQFHSEEGPRVKTIA